MPPASSESAAADEILAAEREHLRRSRDFLDVMRTDVLSLRAMGGDPVSEQYLKADLHRRAEALRDLPDTPLFFGRLDYRPGALAGAAPKPRSRIRPAMCPAASTFMSAVHVHDPQGTPVVIDWRAPVSRPFYRASQAEPMGLDRRRRFGFSGGELTAFEDEGFGRTRPEGRDEPDPDRRNRAAASAVRDIVATIQPDQDDIVRAGVDYTVCVQGLPVPARRPSGCTGWPTPRTPCAAAQPGWRPARRAQQRVPGL